MLVIREAVLRADAVSSSCTGETKDTNGPQEQSNNVIAFDKLLICRL